MVLAAAAVVVVGVGWKVSATAAVVEAGFFLLHDVEDPAPWINNRLSWVSRYTAEKLVKPR